MNSNTTELTSLAKWSPAHSVNLVHNAHSEKFDGLVRMSQLVLRPNLFLNANRDSIY